MKVLVFNGFFELPNDFNGDINDALEEHLRYRKNLSPDYPKIADKKDEKDLKAAEKKDSLSDYRLELWDKFIKYRNKGYKLFGIMSLLDWNEKKGKWVEIKNKKAKK